MARVSREEANLLKLDKMLCFSIYSTAHAFNRIYKPLLDRLGLTYPQYLVMLCLWEQDGVVVKEIGERLFLDSGTLTPLLKRLEGLELVQRVRDKEDERQVRIHLTTKGKRLRSQAMKVPRQVAEATGHSNKDLRTLQASLNYLRHMLKDFDELGA